MSFVQEMSGAMAGDKPPRVPNDERWSPHVKCITINPTHKVNSSFLFKLSRVGPRVIWGMVSIAMVSHYKS